MMEDPELLDRMKKHLYSGESVLGQGSPFSELLQQMESQMYGVEISAGKISQKLFEFGFWNPSEWVLRSQIPVVAV